MKENKGIYTADDIELSNDEAVNVFIWRNRDGGVRMEKGYAYGVYINVRAIAIETGESIEYDWQLKYIN